MEIGHFNWHDIEKYFLDTYVKFKETGETIFRITSVNPDFLTATSLGGEEVGIDLHRPYNIDFLLPKKASFNYADTVYHLQRIPARQWKKGISKQNTAFARWDGASWKASPFDPSLLEGFVNKAAYVKPELVKQMMVDGPNRAVAISPRTTVTSNGGVFVDTTLVGKYNFEKDIVTTKQLFEIDMKNSFPFAKFKVLK